MFTKKQKKQKAKTKHTKQTKQGKHTKQTKQTKTNMTKQTKKHHLKFRKLRGGSDDLPEGWWFGRVNGELRYIYYDHNKALIISKDSVNKISDKVNKLSDWELKIEFFNLKYVTDEKIIKADILHSSELPDVMEGLNFLKASMNDSSSIKEYLNKKLEEEREDGILEMFSSY